MSLTGISDNAVCPSRIACALGSAGFTIQPADQDAMMRHTRSVDGATAHGIHHLKQIREALGRGRASSAETSMRSGPAQSMRRLAVLFALLTLTPSAVPTAWAAEPVISVWYRGNPAGTPRQSDLGAIRALGFTGVVWPKKFDAGVVELRRLAALVGLTIVVADAPVQATGESTLTPPERVDIVITPDTAGLVTALCWRAVAHGARSIAFDSGSPTGAGLIDRDDSLKEWVPSAISVARQLTANSRLADVMRPGPGVTVTPNATPALDVVLLDANRAWVVVATNTSSAVVNATARLPAGTPYALWVSWLEGPPLAMISEPAGPRWVLNLEPRGARVYIIDKIMKEQAVKQ